MLPPLPTEKGLFDCAKGPRNITGNVQLYLSVTRHSVRRFPLRMGRPYADSGCGSSVRAPCPANLPQSIQPSPSPRISRHPGSARRRVQPPVEAPVARIAIPVLPPEMPPIVPPVSAVRRRQAEPEIAIRAPIAIVEIAVIAIVPPVIGIARPGQRPAAIHIIAARRRERSGHSKRESGGEMFHVGMAPVVGTGGRMRLRAGGGNQGMCVWGVRGLDFWRQIPQCSRPIRPFH